MLLPALSWRFFVWFSAFKVLFAPGYHSTDFEVHRNWLAVTGTQPPSLWYYEATSEWTLDYPPLFALFQWALSLIARVLAGPEVLTLSASPVLTPGILAFQRGSVIAVDAVLWWAARRGVEVGAWPAAAAWLAVTSPGLLLVDHVHFQYNGMLFGVMLLSLSLLAEGRTLAGAAVFAVLLNLKHIFLYMAPFFFVHLLATHCTSVGRFLGLAASVTAVFAGSLALVVRGPADLAQLLSRLFPFGRGLLHAYWAPNAWALYHVADNALARLMRVAPAALPARGLVGEATRLAVLPAVTPAVSLGLAVLAGVPALVAAWRRPSRSGADLALRASVCCMGFFLFGWHVHEKAILMVILPLALAATTERSPLLARGFWLINLAGTYSLIPLLFGAREALLRALLVLLSAALAALLAPPRLSRLESLYSLGFIPLHAAITALPVLLPAMPFLPLLLISTYSAIGIVSGYAILVAALFSAK
jgi:alpha-1,3-glucosyltransferase